jgi:cell division protein FtsB
MPVSNQDIMKKLDRIEQLILKVSSEEEEELKGQKKIEEEEERELEELDETVNLEFSNAEDWRQYIWEGCPFKKQVSKKGEIDFFCKKLNSACRFEGCPLNMKWEKKK